MAYISMRIPILAFTAGIFSIWAGLASAELMKVVDISAGDTLNVRTGPGSNFQDIGDIQPSQFVVVLGYDATGNWAKVRYQGRIAFVSSRYLKSANRGDGSSVATGPHEVTGIKAGDPDGGLVVRDGPGTNYTNIGVLSNHTNVHVIQRSNDGKWAMIPVGTGVGWVSAAYLNSLQAANTPTPEPMPSPTPQTAPDGGDLPAMFTVTGVALNDSLNFRDKPSTSGNIIGRFAPGADVQVLGMASGNWAYVTNGEIAGYVNIRYLTRSGGNGFVLGILCRGTEPFWTFEVADDRTATYTPLIGGMAAQTSLVQTTPSSMTGGYPFAFSAPPYSGLIRTQQCSDGMSDINYTMSISLNTPGQFGGNQTLYGCCSVQP